jgi:hypothetical protein
MLLINAGLAPFLPFDAPYAETAASSIFLWRQSLAMLATVLLLLGSIGLYLHSVDQIGRFGAIAFMLTFIGCALVLANEWCTVFFVRSLALKAPEVLTELDAAEGPSLYDIGALIALITFTIGWIIFSLSMLIGGVYSRCGPILVIAGFILIPILGAALPGVWGAIAGQGLLGSGWIVLGYELSKGV